MLHLAVAAEVDADTDRSAAEVWFHSAEADLSVAAQTAELADHQAELGLVQVYRLGKQAEWVHWPCCTGHALAVTQDTADCQSTVAQSVLANLGAAVLLDVKTSLVVVELIVPYTVQHMEAGQ